MRKKIALCLSGDPRSSMFCFPYIYESILQYDQNIFDIDVYIHSWKGFRALSLYNPKKYLIDNLDTDTFYWNHFNQLSTDFNFHHHSPFKNSLLMFYGLKKVWEMVEDEYDYYIRCRFDILFKNEFSLPHLVNELEESKCDIITPTNYPSKNYKEKINDQFAIGKFKGMNLYFNIWDNLFNLVKNNQVTVPEDLLKIYFDNHNIKIQQKHFMIFLIRNAQIQSFPAFNNFQNE